MRAADSALPTVELHDDPELLLWPIRPVIAIRGLQDVKEWDDPRNLWDVNDNEGMGPTTSRVGMAVVGTATVGSP